MTQAFAEFDRMERSVGLGAFQPDENHTVTVSETQGTLIRYDFVVHGTATPGPDADPEDFTVEVGEYTIVSGAVNGGTDSWNVQGGIVQQQFAGPSGTGGLQVSLDGAATTPGGLVSSTGGEQPPTGSPPQCTADADCQGDLVCEGESCAVPEGYCDPEEPVPEPQPQYPIDPKLAAVGVVGGVGVYYGYRRYRDGQ